MTTSRELFFLVMKKSKIFTICNQSLREGGSQQQEQRQYHRYIDGKSKGLMDEVCMSVVKGEKL